MILKLPCPPSVNNAYINVQHRGRVKSKRYKAWLKEADAWYYLQRLHQLKPIRGPRSIHIRLPKVRGDLDNYIKLTCDYLVSRGLTGDDKHNVRVTVESDPEMEVRFCWVTVTEAS